MDKYIKECIDRHDVKGLKYIFSDALEADPTFENYEEAFVDCKSKGLLEEHVELTPLTEDRSRWTEEYWVQLKLDLVKNFSERRMNHMREVAQVVLSDKFKRICNERAQRREASPESLLREPERHTEHLEKRPSVEKPKQPNPAPGSKQRAEKERLERRRRELAEENRKEEEERQRKKRVSQEATTRKEYSAQDETDPKKALGIVAAVAAVAIIVLLLK